MLLHFYKLVGAGNDFVAIDNRSLKYNLDKQQIAALCHRQFGIGADGFLSVEPAVSPEADFRMRYYNADGGEAEMCGNGARCFALFCSALLEQAPQQLKFDTMAGLISAEFVDGDVRTFLSAPHSLQLNTLAYELAAVHFINTGVPHAVLFVDDVAAVDVKKHGAALRYHEHFAPAGTNVNFVQVLDAQHIKIRTYERGVEDETLACGTGVTAAALIHHLLSGATAPIKVSVAGQVTMQVEFANEQAKDFCNVSLQGPAEFVFEGSIEL